MNELIIQHINNRYKFFHSIAFNMIHDEYKADDVLSTVIHQIIDRKKPIKHNGNIDGYIYKALANQVYGFSKYNRMFTWFNADVDCQQYINEEDTEYNDTYEQLLIAVDTSDKLTWYQKKLWKLYYANEYVVNIKGMEKKEVDIIRKMSYRMITKKVGIDYNTIGKVVNEVNRIMMDDFKKIRKDVNNR